VRIASLILAKYMCDVKHEDDVCSISQSSIGVLISVADQRQVIDQPGALRDPGRNDAHKLEPIISGELFQEVPMISRYAAGVGSSPFRRNRSDSKQLQNAAPGGIFHGRIRRIWNGSDFCVASEALAFGGKPVAFVMLSVAPITGWDTDGGEDESDGVGVSSQVSTTVGSVGQTPNQPET
jgi:hypothetical protein